MVVFCSRFLFSCKLFVQCRRVSKLVFINFRKLGVAKSGSFTLYLGA